MKNLWLFLPLLACPLMLIMFLTGCSAGNEQQERPPPRPMGAIVSDTMNGTMQGIWRTVQMPFEDLNLKRQSIPERLQKVAANPYAPPQRVLCADLIAEITELNALLGPDVCTPGNPTGAPLSPRYVEQGAGIVQDEAVGLVDSKINILPFRGVVRKITGAERHAKQVEYAYEAGRLRRAFLRGLALSLGPDCICPDTNNAPQQNIPAK